MDEFKYIRNHYGKYQVRINGKSLGTYNTIDEALKVRDNYVQENQSTIQSNAMKSPKIFGVTNHESYVIQDIWNIAEKNFYLNEEKNKKRNQQIIEFPNEPIAIALLSDLHIGNSNTDYKQLRKDAEIIQKTDGMYAIFHGDGIDNWIVPKLMQLQRGQTVNFEQELLLFESWMNMILTKLIVVVAGNHDNWTFSLSGIDVVKELLKHTTVLYDRDEVRTTIKVGDKKWEFCIRHKWLGSSIYNPTHGIERYSRMGATFDVGIGGHTHIASLSREFISNDNRQCFAIITGTYKKYDGFARQLGLPQCPHSGSGAIILNPNGTMLWIRSLEEASQYITFLRKNYK